MDQQLNEVYKDVLQNFRSWKGKGSDNRWAERGKQNAEYVMSTEKSWIKYRDSWVNFSKLRYPTLPEDAVKAWLTVQRVKDLKKLLEFAKEEKIEK